MSEKTYYVGKMTCANCAQEVEDGVARLDGVQSVRVDFMSNKMTLDGDVPFDSLRDRVESLGKTLHDKRETPSPQPSDANAVVGFWNYLLSRRDLRLALAGGLLTVVTLVGSIVGVPAAITRTLYTVSVLVTVYPIAKSGLNNLMTNRRFNVNLLMTVAVFGAIVLGEYLEAATVIFLFVIGEALEGYTTDRARQSIQSLVELRPETAVRLDEDEREQVVPVEVLRVGERILVRPGERIPMDGRVRSGSSTVDQSPITGESVPVLKETDNEVYAGTINGDGTITVEVTQPADDNTLSRIIQLVEDAQSKQAPSQRMINRFANWYTPSVLVLAIGVAAIPPLLWSAPATEWVYRALAMLVIACPCALVISTPVTVISAISAAARRGILIKGGVHLEALGQIRTVAFDKTGTLTEGRPQVTDYHALDCIDAPDCGRCDDVLALANAVERRTTHPLAQAVVQQAQSHQLADRYAPAQNVQTVPGRGVRGDINGHSVTLGSHAWFDAVLPHSEAICDEVRAVEERGQTVMMLGVDEDVRGYITLSDTAREAKPRRHAKAGTDGHHHRHAHRRQRQRCPRHRRRTRRQRCSQRATPAAKSRHG